MNLGESKFDIGQTVWQTRKKVVTQHEACKQCNGDAKREIVWASGTIKEVICEHCLGLGRERYAVISHTVEVVLARKGVVTGIELSIPRRWSSPNKSKTGREITYSLKDVVRIDLDKDDNSNVFFEDRLFGSEEEALQTCHGPQKFAGSHNWEQ